MNPPNIFGQQNQNQQQGGFNQQTQQSATFGQQLGQQPFASQQQNGLFGQNSTPGITQIGSSSGFNSFGSNNTPAFGANTFGSNNNTANFPQANKFGSSFGSSVPAAPANNVINPSGIATSGLNTGFGSSNMSGINTTGFGGVTAPSSNIFGNNSTPNAFASGSNSFGANSNAFSNHSSAFATQPNTFGGPANSFSNNPNPIQTSNNNLANTNTPSVFSTSSNAFGSNLNNNGFSANTNSFGSSNSNVATAGLNNNAAAMPNGLSTTTSGFLPNPGSTALNTAPGMPQNNPVFNNVNSNIAVDSTMATKCNVGMDSTMNFQNANNTILEMEKELSSNKISESNINLEMNNSAIQNSSIANQSNLVSSIKENSVNLYNLTLQEIIDRQATILEENIREFQRDSQRVFDTDMNLIRIKNNYIETQKKIEEEGLKMDNLFEAIEYFDKQLDSLEIKESSDMAKCVGEFEKIADKFYKSVENFKDDQDEVLDIANENYELIDLIDSKLDCLEKYMK
jgi:hypothetical protein